MANRMANIYSKYGYIITYQICIKQIYNDYIIDYQKIILILKELSETRVQNVD